MRLKINDILVFPQRVLEHYKHHNYFCSACYTLRYVSDPNSDSSYDVANELLRPVLPKPLDDRQVDEDEGLPLLPVHWRENVSTDRLGDQVHKEVLYLQEEKGIQLHTINR